MQEIPTDLSLLDRPLRLYIIFAHGQAVYQGTQPKSIQVKKNMHIIGQTRRNLTYLHTFQSVTNFWKTANKSHYSINEVYNILTPILTANTLNDFGYFPSGVHIRNLNLSRDYPDPRVHPMGVFQIGVKRPIAILKYDPTDMRRPNNILTDYDIGQPLNLRNEILELKSNVAGGAGASGAAGAAGAAATIADSNTMYNAIDFIDRHGDQNEEKLIVVLACAGNAPGAAALAVGENGYTAKESELTNSNGSPYFCAMPDNDIRLIRFNEANFRNRIARILSNNLIFNNRLHLTIDQPIGPNLYMYRSTQSFNSLLTKITHQCTYLIINNIKYPGDDMRLCNTSYDIIQTDDMQTLAANRNKTIIKIPAGYKFFLFSPVLQMIQFYNNFSGNQKPGALLGAPPGATLAPAPEAAPGAAQDPGAGGVPASLITAQMPIDVISNLISNDNYYDKYLKYKNKYLNIKNMG